MPSISVGERMDGDEPMVVPDRGLVSWPGEGLRIGGLGSYVL